jgi:formate hydrogenlyase subunit 3/multisubunit Na+/H+ antiporter MnhD subunit
MGYLLLGVALFNPHGYAAAALLYLSHGLGKAVLFMTAGYFIMHLHTRDVEKMGGTLRLAPRAGWRRHSGLPKPSRHLDCGHGI